MTVHRWRALGIILLLAAAWCITVGFFGWPTWIVAAIGAALWIDTHPRVRRE